MSLITAREADKYARMWNVEDYARFSPGEQWLPMFLALAERHTGTLLDAGCGDGRVGMALRDVGFDVTLADLTSDQLLPMAKKDFPFIDGPLWNLDRSDPPLPCFNYGFCCDVMEHVPPEFTMLTIARLVECCDRTFLTICTEPDAFGVRIGEPLHLTVQPFTWWRDRIAEITTIHDARDCLNTGVFYIGD